MTNKLDGEDMNNFVVFLLCSKLLPLFMSSSVDDILEDTQTCFYFI